MMISISINLHLDVEHGTSGNPKHTLAGFQGLDFGQQLVLAPIDGFEPLLEPELCQANGFQLLFGATVSTEGHDDLRIPAATAAAC